MYFILAVAFLFVLMPFLFWQATWFGRPLNDAQILAYLSDREHPRKTQHALAQIAERMVSRDPAARASAQQWYPQVVALSTHSLDELRLTAAWVMGQDNAAEEFHQALRRLLGDSHPMVRRNAALSLVRFGDPAGRPVLITMLEPYTVISPQAGTLLERLKPGDVVNPGTLVGRIQQGGQKFEVRSQVPGTLIRWVAADAATVSAGETLALLDPSPEMLWEALRALYLVGQADDLPAIERYARGVSDMPENIRRQADLAARAIRARSVGRP